MNSSYLANLLNVDLGFKDNIKDARLYEVDHTEEAHSLTPQITHLIILDYGVDKEILGLKPIKIDRSYGLVIETRQAYEENTAFSRTLGIELNAQDIAELLSPAPSSRAEVFLSQSVKGRNIRNLSQILK